MLTAFDGAMKLEGNACIQGPLDVVDALPESESSPSTLQLDNEKKLTPQ